MPDAAYSTTPIVATCSMCGADGLIIANPPPKGSFQCSGTALHSVPEAVRPILRETIRNLKAAK
jgi:hypothetical protein